jgi:hypothetical protein
MVISFKSQQNTFTPNVMHTAPKFSSRMGECPSAPIPLEKTIDIQLYILSFSSELPDGNFIVRLGSDMQGDHVRFSYALP